MALDWCTTGALVVLAAWLLWKYLSWNYSHWERLGVPGPEPSVPFGNLIDGILGKKHAAEVFRDFYNQMEGQPFFGVYRFRQPLLVVRDAELMRAMLISDFASFHDNNVQANEELDPIFARNPFVLRGEKWRRLRSQLSPSFTASRLKPMFLLMGDVCDHLERTLRLEGPAAGPDGLEARGLCLRFMTDVVSSCALGIKGGALDDKNAPMLVTFCQLFRPSIETFIAFTLGATFPRLVSLLRLRFMPKEVDEFLRTVVKQTIARREHEGEHRNDYLQMLVELKTKGYLDSAGQVLADKHFFTDVDITAQVMTFMTDGIHTSATAMSFVLYELAQHPAVQQRLRRELREAVDKHGGRLGYAAIQDCAYLDMVLSETLRLNPPGGVLEKVCTASYQLETAAGNTVALQPGDVVVVPAYALHHDARYFPDPETFDPERFSPDNKDRSAMQAYVAFGLGPRSCIGQRFAQSQVKMGVAAIVLNFEVGRTPRTTTTIKMDPKFILVGHKDGLWVSFQPLKP